MQKINQTSEIIIIIIIIILLMQIEFIFENGEV
jgi:hypothetical protein